MAKKKWYYEEMQYTPEEMKLINNNKNMIPYVWSKLDNYSLKMSYRDDLFAAGFEGLCVAAKTYDPNRGTFAAHSYMIIYKKMSIEIKRLNKLTKNIISIDEPIYSKKRSEPSYLKDILVDYTEDVEQRGIDRDMARRIWRVALKVCNKTEIKILYLYSYKGMNISEIGRELGFSREYIRQLFNKAREKILEKMQTNT